MCSVAPEISFSTRARQSENLFPQERMDEAVLVLCVGEKCSDQRIDGNP